MLFEHLERRLVPREDGLERELRRKMFEVAGDVVVAARDVERQPLAQRGQVFDPRLRRARHRVVCVSAREYEEGACDPELGVDARELDRHLERIVDVVAEEQGAAGPFVLKRAECKSVLEGCAQQLPICVERESHWQARSVSELPTTLLGLPYARLPAGRVS